MAPTVVVTEFMVERALAPLREHHSVLYDPGLHGERERLVTLLGSARGLIVRNQTNVDRGVLEAAPNLEVVGRLGVGLDNIDMAACKERSIVVHPALGANAAAVAEYVIGALFALVRGVYGATAEVSAGDWPRQALTTAELSGKTLGLVGYGAIAREVADRARALGMDIVGFDPFIPADSPLWQGARMVDLDSLFAESDAVSLHVPLTADTKQMVDADRLTQMPANAVLINTARGGIVDEAALIEALRSGSISGAAIDVFADEPITAASGRVFADVPNLILTPHIAGLTSESQQRVSEVTVANVLAVLGDGTGQ